LNKSSGDPRAGRGVHPTHLTKPLRRVGAMAIDAGAFIATMPISVRVQQ
jgi:hypothetical protein